MENKITFVYQTIPLQYVLNVSHLYPGKKTAELIVTGSITKTKKKRGKSKKETAAFKMFL